MRYFKGVIETSSGMLGLYYCGESEHWVLTRINGDIEKDFEGDSIVARYAPNVSYKDYPQNTLFDMLQFDYPSGYKFTSCDYIEGCKMLREKLEGTKTENGEYRIRVSSYSDGYIEFDITPLVERLDNFIKKNL